MEVESLFLARCPRRIESATIEKLACQCTDGLSATQNGLEAAMSSNTLCWNQTWNAWLTATHLNHSAMDSCQSTEKNDISLVVFRNLRLLFLLAGLLFSNCSGWISRPGTRCPNSWTQTFDWYIFIMIWSHSTKIGVEIFSLTIFAHCSSSSSST